GLRPDFHDILDMGEIGQREGMLVDLGAGLEGREDHDDNGRQHDHAVGDKDDLDEPVAPQRAQQARTVAVIFAGHAHSWISRARSLTVMTLAMTAMNRKISTASALPMPKFCVELETVPKAVR